jgi:sulfate adenylyltransferase subunit 2
MTTDSTDTTIRADESLELSDLDTLEAESIFVIREVIAEFEHPVMLFSGGKDSVLMLHLARRAFAPAPIPFPIMHVDTGHNFPEVLEFRDRVAEELGLRLEVSSVEEMIDQGRVKVSHPLESRNRHQTVALLDGIQKGGFDAVFGGGRRDEDKARAKERVLSFRDRFGQWDPKNQRPELWSLYNGRHRKGEHIRVFPISDWTELDVWRYLAREQVELPQIYFAHEREVVEHEGLLMAVNEFFPLPEGMESQTEMVRYRTVGDATSTGAVASTATDYEAVIAETAASRITERGATRGDDRFSEAAMEDRKREGYF